jgi:ssDNA-binding replication factor A large subunit
MATLWGPLASSENIEIGKVMAVKGAKCSDYGGKSLNISES